MTPNSPPVVLQAHTHLRIDTELVGAPLELSAGYARVSLRTHARMIADDAGLVHGGFVFGLADYAAMLAVNDPNVVLGEATTRFLAPVTLGEEVVAVAQISAEKGRKREVRVECAVGEKKIFEGNFVCFVLDAHVLQRREA